MGLFVHVPWPSVSVWPCWAVPEIVGGAVLAGAAGSTTAVWAELAGWLEPPAFEAVSCTLMVCPTSSATGTYVWLVAPPIVAQLAPEPSHCSHWYSKLVGLFVQVP